MIEYRLVRGRRKTVSIRVLPEGEVEVRAPLLYAKYKIDALVRQKEPWIRQRLKHAASVLRQPPLTEQEHNALIKEAKSWIPARAAQYAARMGVTFGTVTIRTQRSRWGSCSAEGNLNFNCLLMLAPEPVRDYVVVHELCHRIEMNHSSAFWAQVERVLPDYRAAKKWLRDNGAALLARRPDQ